MALQATISLPLTLTQPRLSSPVGCKADLAELSKQVASLHAFILSLQTVIQTMYNDFVTAIAAQNLQGLDADLPPFGVPGRRFVATDTKLLYLDIGTAWLQVALT